MKTLSFLMGIAVFVSGSALAAAAHCTISAKQNDFVANVVKSFDYSVSSGGKTAKVTHVRLHKEALDELASLIKNSPTVAPELTAIAKANDSKSGIALSGVETRDGSGRYQLTVKGLNNENFVGLWPSEAFTLVLVTGKQVQLYSTGGQGMSYTNYECR